MVAVDKVGVALFALGSATAVGLGAWQLVRRQAKIEQISNRRNQLTSGTITNLGTTDTADAWSRVSLPTEGRFLETPQFLVGPRGGPLIVTGRRKKTGISAGGLGYNVITPFVLEGGRVLLVSRGWCQRRLVDDALSSVVNEPKSGLIGILRPSEPNAGNATAHKSNVFVRMDAVAMIDSFLPPEQEAMMTMFVDLIDEGGSAPSPALHRRVVDDFIRFPTSPETHAGYAFTWFALSATIAVIAAIRFRRKPPAHLHTRS